MKQAIDISKAPAGFSYIEVLIAVALIAICLSPMLDALQTMTTGTGGMERIELEKNAVKSKLEEVMAQPFADLTTAISGPTTPSTYSDSFTTVNGLVLTRNVYLAAYDATNGDADNDPFTGGGLNLLYVKVKIYGSSISLETLISG